MIHLSASLLAADYARMGEEVRRADQAGVDSFHFDLMDAHYVPNLALTPQHLTSLKPYTCLPFNIHLELSNPHKILDTFPLSEADLIIVQADTLDRSGSIFEKISSRGARAGLSLNPQDELACAMDWLPGIDTLLLLGVNPGFGGQKMQPGILEKMTRARKLLLQSGRPIHLAVDGGINLDNIPSLVKAGADILIIGSAIFGACDIRERVEQIRRLCQS